MTDIVSRLRQTRADMLGTDDEQHYWDCHDAAAEIERLRQSDRLQPVKIEVEQLRLAIRRLADQDATLSVCDGAVTVTMDATPDTNTTPGEGSVQSEGTLTDEERAAIMASQGFWALEDSPHAATLRNLLERLR